MSEIIFEGATVDELLDYLATTEEAAVEEVVERGVLGGLAGGLGADFDAVDRIEQAGAGQGEEA